MTAQVVYFRTPKECPKDWLTITANLFADGLNPDRTELAQALKEFFRTLDTNTFVAKDDWEFQYFYCSMPRELAVLFVLANPRYCGRFK